jgi:hypothetical protein
MEYGLLLAQTVKSILNTPTLWLLMPIVLNEIAAEALARRRRMPLVEVASAGLDPRSDLARLPNSSRD